MVKVSVLYLDDEEPLVCLVTHLLTRIGYDVCGFTTRDEALAALFWGAYLDHRGNVFQSRLVAIRAVRRAICGEQA